MHHQRGLVRAACTARNAYNPKLALASALLACSNEPALKLFARRRPSHAGAGRTRLTQRRSLSSVRRLEASAQAAAETEDGDHGEPKHEEEQEHKPQRKGTFAGYEALMGSFGNAKPQKQDDDGNATRLAQDATSAVYGSGFSSRSAGKSVPERRSTSSYSQERTPSAEISVLRPLDFDNHYQRRGASRVEATSPLVSASKNREHIPSRNQDLAAGPNRSGRKEDLSKESRAVGDRGQVSKPRRGFARGKEMQLNLNGSQSEKEQSACTGTNGGAPFNAQKDWRAHMHRIGEQANDIAQQKSSLSQEELESMTSKMDYQGFPINPEEPTLDSQMPCPWVVKPTAEASRNGMDILNAEIKLFAEYTQPSPAETAARDAVKEEMTSFIDAHVGRFIITDTFGSARTGLAIATSDLDFRMRLKPQIRKKQQSDDEFKLRWIKHVSVVMSRHPDWIAVVLRNARFPIINAQHRETGIDIQIVSSPSTKAQHDATMNCLQSIPNLRSLYYVVKYLFSMRGLVDVFNGGTGSYGLLMMLVASLTRRGNSYTHADAGTQLLQFLGFYCEHDYARNGIAIAPLTPTSKPETTLFRKHAGNSIPRRGYIRAAYNRDDPVRAGQWSIGQRRAFQPYLPCIQDPANPLNDLGRKMNAIKHIVATLQQIRTDLRAKLAAADSGELESGTSLLSPVVVGRCHEVYFERRKRVEEFGLAVLRREKGSVRRVTESTAVSQQRQHRQREKERAQVVETAWAG